MKEAMKKKDNVEGQSSRVYAKRLLRIKSERYHITGAWAAAILVPLWSILDYYTFREHFVVFTILRLAVFAMILGAIYLFRKKKVNVEFFGFLVVAPIALMSAYMMGVANADEFIFNVIGLMALFICAGMILVWPMHYSVTFVAVTTIAILIARNFLSPMSFSDMMAKGGMLLFTVMVIFIIQVKARYDLICKEINNAAKLKTSEHQHRLLFAQNPVPMLIYDLKGLNIVEVNDAMCHHYGYSEEELSTMTILQLGAADEQQSIRRQIRQIKNGQAATKEYRHFKKDGTPIIMQTVARSISYKQRKCRLVLLIDITREKELNKHLIEAKEIAEEAKKAEEQFFASMSHEIRTPMNGILGMTRLLKDHPDKERRTEYLDAIEVSATNLLSIVNDILDFSKIGAGKMALEEVPFSLKRVAHTLAITFSQIIREKNISIRWRFDNRIPKLLLGDPVRINQIINNLVGNAIKFTSVGGVTVDLKAEEMDDNRLTLMCAVSDTGDGISKENLKQIFEHYSQTGKDITRKYGGTGLGLAITKQLVDIMNGHIEVKSRLKKGTTFTVRIPLKVAHKETGPDGKRVDESTKVNVNKSADKPMEILLVEDNKINQVLATTLLKKRGFKVSVCRDGEQALERLGTTHFDLVLLDIDLPGMNGLEVAAEIRKSVHLRDLPLIAMTASTLRRDIQTCLDAGINDYIPKPFDPKALFECIEKNTLRKSA